MVQRSHILIAVPLGCLGILAGAGCTADWLSDPVVADRLWPSDINSWIVELLGGSGASPSMQLQLSWFSVAIRYFGLTATVLAMGRLCNRKSAAVEVCSQLLMRLGIVGIGCGLIWAIQPYITNEFALALSPMLMLLAGAALWSLVSAGIGPIENSGRSGVRRAFLLLLIVTAAWICVSFRLNERLYANLLIPHGDSAMYEEHLWNVWHGKGFRSYLDQGLFLGEHIQVIHLLLLPAHMIWPSQLTLELAESIALGSCTIPLFLIVLRRTNDTWAACLLAMSWLFFFPMHFLDIAIDQKTFRPVCLGLPFLFWMIQSAEFGRYRRAWVFLLIALSAKEDMALITAPVGVVMALDAWRGGSARRSLKNWGIAAAAVSAVWLLLAVLVVIPMFRSGDVVHYSRYFGELGSSPRELVLTALSEPGLILARIFSLRTLLYAIVLLAPIAFVAIRSPWQLAAGSLTFVMLSLLQLGNGPDGGGLPPVPYHHFHAPLLPVVFWAAACAAGKFGSHHLTTAYYADSWPRRRCESPSSIAPASQNPPRHFENCSKSTLLPASPSAAALLVFCCCVATGMTGSVLPFGASYWSNASPFGRHALYDPREDTAAGRLLIRRAKMADVVVDRIPLTARVASTDFIHTRLTHCERSYDYSDYERVVNEAGQRVPADCDYIVIDTGHRYSSIRGAASVPELKEADGWMLLPDTTDGQFLILHRPREVPRREKSGSD